MKLLTITVCVDYADILEICIKENLQFLNPKDWFIISSNKDKDTQKLCEKYNLSCSTTDYFNTNYNGFNCSRVFYENNCQFNKAAALNELFRKLQKQKLFENNFDWILLLDADIILNDSLKFMSHESNNILYDQSCFYSCARKIFNTPDDLLKDNGHIEKIDFIGYFQLFHKDKIIHDLINEKTIFPEFPTACRYDDAFRDKYWPNRRKYIQIPGLVYHLGPIATNWSGRISPQWKGESNT